MTKIKMKKTKAELLVEMNNLKNEIKNQNELLINAGIKKRKTMLSEIELLESDTRKHILYIIKECEKKTGRKLVPAHGFNEDEFKESWDNSDCITFTSMSPEEIFDERKNVIIRKLHELIHDLRRSGTKRSSLITQVKTIIRDFKLIGHGL